ncbi:MAG: flagellar basal-body rod protein FlgG [Bacteriovoracia bacterium]
MERALTTAATGLQAQQANIERISNDLANVNTDGYKRSRTEFQDLMYQTIKEPGTATGVASQSPVGIERGMGVKVGAEHKIHDQGPARMTYHPYDFMIEGPGFFPVQMPNGEVGYTRVGSFHRDAQGRLYLTNGAQMVPQVTVPNNAINVVVTGGGEVKATMPDSSEVTIGQIQLIRFQNEEGLSAGGGGIYRVTAASGPPLQGIPGENGYGTIQQGALEGSNVNVPNAMVDMIATQRAYEMNTKVMGIADQMMSATVNIK